MFTRDAAPRASVSLSAPGSVERPPWLQRLVTAMDEQAFPNGGPLALKLSYELSPLAPATPSARDETSARVERGA